MTPTKTFWRFASFELRLQFGRPLVAGLCVLLPALVGATMALDPTVFGGGGGVRWAAPQVIARAQALLSIPLMFVIAAVVSAAVLRDQESRFGPIVRAVGVAPAAAMLGKLAGSTTTAVLVSAAVALGLWLGAAMPWLPAAEVGPNVLGDHGAVWAMFTVPTVLAVAAILAAATTLSRSVAGTFVAAVALLLLHGAALLGGSASWAAWLDPFGLSVMSDATRFWTPHERNSLLPILEPAVIRNRVLWLAVGVGMTWVVALGHPNGTTSPPRAGPADFRDPAPPADRRRFEPRFTAATTWKQFCARVVMDVRGILFSPAFLLVAAMGLVASAFALSFARGMFGTTSVPIAPVVVRTLESAAGFLPFVIAIYFAGELVWRDRLRRVHEFVDASPLPDALQILPKAIAVFVVLAMTSTATSAVGMAFQALRGADVEAARLLLWFALPQATDMVLLTGLALLMHSVAPNRYAGWALMFAFVAAVNVVIDATGYDNLLLVPGSGPPVPRADMNGLGDYWIGAWVFRAYWAGWGVLMLTAAHLLWRRGSERRLLPVLRRAPSRLAGWPGVTTVIALVLVATSGAFAWHSTSVLNEYVRPGDEERRLADIEQRYLQHADEPQPTLRSVELRISLYPEERRAETAGHYVLENTGSEPIRTLHIRLADPLTQLVQARVADATIAHADAELGYWIHALGSPLPPGDRIRLEFRTRRAAKGFRSRNPDTRLVANGVFLDSLAIAPTIGMDRSGLLRDPEARRRLGLPAEMPPAPLEDEATRRTPAFRSAWASSDITVSTAADQTPLAPGRRVTDEVRGGRRTARFVAEAPIHPFFSIQSARYAVARRHHAGVDLEVYHHPGHARNVERMLGAMQLSLDVYRKRFGPYPLSHARIVEFPGYARFAQAFAGTVPVSEEVGFITELSADDIDVVTFAIAHELAHQYWAHQVIPAPGEGDGFLTESLAQYSALLVMRERHGVAAMPRLLRHEMERYLAGRGFRGTEVAVMRASGQAYLQYHKGALVLYQLQELLGEGVVDRALASLLGDFRFRAAPFPRPADLIERLREATGIEGEKAITDRLARISVHDLSIDSPVAQRIGKSRWRVQVPVRVGKRYADAGGATTEADPTDRYKVGLFRGDPGQPGFKEADIIAIESRALVGGRQVVEIETDTLPTHAGIDPYHLYVDREPSDNVARVRLGGSGAGLAAGRGSQ